MLKIILTVIGIVIVLTLIMFILLRRIVKTINEQTKVFFMMKLQSYDDMIEAKQQELNTLKAQEITKETEDTNPKEDQSNNSVSVVIPKDTPVYKVEGLVDIIRQIDKEFNHDFKAIILEFAEKSKNKNNEYYEELSKVKEKLDNYGLFNLVIKSKDEQLEIIKQLEITKTNLYKKYDEQYNKFSINDFIKFLDIEFSKNDTTIYVYVGNEKENYDDLASNIKTIYDKNIIRGIKIKYQNNVYEYHLSY